MPVYDYRCNDCGNITEVFVQNSESKAYKCVNCGSQSMEKLFSSSYMIKMGTQSAPESTTCCGRSERCDTPPCSADNPCCRS